MAGNTPKTVLSINITTMKAYLGVLFLIVALASSVFGAITTIGKLQIRKTVEPIVTKCVADEVSKQLVDFRIKENKRLADIQTTLKTLTAQNSQNSEMLQLLLRDRLAHSPSGSNPQRPLRASGSE